MKKFLANIKIPQVVFLILSLVLAFQTIYLTLQGVETSLFNNVLLIIIGFYYGKTYGKKGGENDTDTLVEGDLDDNKI